MKFDQLTAQQQLQVCNLTSGGMGLAEAIKKATTKPAATAAATTEGEPAKLTNAEKKAQLAEQITALGGTPPESGSIAKFEEALAEAKAAAEGDTEATGTEGAADLM